MNLTGLRCHYSTCIIKFAFAVVFAAQCGVVNSKNYFGSWTSRCSKICFVDCLDWEVPFVAHEKHGNSINSYVPKASDVCNNFFLETV